MEEKEWKDSRDKVLKTLRLMSLDLTTIKHSDVLLKAEEECCEDLKNRTESILLYWDERSVISRQRFVTEVSDDEG